MVERELRWAKEKLALLLEYSCWCSCSTSIPGCFLHYFFQKKGTGVMTWLVGVASATRFVQVGDML